MPRAATGQSMNTNWPRYVNAAGTESEHLNPNGSAAAPFRSVGEACIYITYNTGNRTGYQYTLNVMAGEEHDYSHDPLILQNTRCVVDLGGCTIPMAKFAAAEVTIKNGTISGSLTAENNSRIRLVNVTVGTITATDSDITMYDSSYANLSAVHSEIIERTTAAEEVGE